MAKEKGKDGSRTKGIGFAVFIDIPEGATQADVESYIKEAILCHRGSLPPEHPCFDLNLDSVNVSRSKFISLVSRIR